MKCTVKSKSLLLISDANFYSYAISLLQKHYYLPDIIISTLASSECLLNDNVVSGIVYIVAEKGPCPDVFIALDKNKGIPQLILSNQFICLFRKRFPWAITLPLNSSLISIIRAMNRIHKRELDVNIKHHKGFDNFQSSLIECISKNVANSDIAINLLAERNNLAPGIVKCRLSRLMTRLGVTTPTERAAFYSMATKILPLWQI